MDLEPVSVDTPDEPSYGIEDRPTEPSSTVGAAPAPFVLPEAPQSPKKESSSKSMPAVLIAVVGIVLVLFVVMRDEGTSSNQSEVTVTVPQTSQGVQQPVETIQTPVKPTPAVAPAKPKPQQPVVKTEAQPAERPAVDSETAAVAVVKPPKIDPPQPTQPKKAGLLADTLNNTSKPLPEVQVASANAAKTRWITCERCSSRREPAQIKANP